MRTRLLLLLLWISVLAAAAGPVTFSSTGHTDYGNWSADATFSPAVWKPGDSLAVSTSITLTEAHLSALKALGLKLDGVCLLVTAERTFDSEGWIRLASDERMSTLLTPTGLGIEGGIQGAITDRFGGYTFHTPVDQFATKALPAASTTGQRTITLDVRQALPADMPPGIYRLRLDYGVTAGKRFYSLNGETFARRPFFKGDPTESQMYAPLVRVSGTHVSGKYVDAGLIEPRLPWTLLAAYNSNGYQGVVADEDRGRFALSNRFIIPDEVILPLYDVTGKIKQAYSLEPQFPTDTIELRNNIPWDYTQGELSVQIANPDGSVTDLGTARWAGAKGQWPTTKAARFTAWKPPTYGNYTVKVSGYTQDIWGNRYPGGGTYHFWIAERMTLATATFQGMAYPVGNHYGRDIAFNPPLPADVAVTATLFPNSDPTAAITVSYTGKATAAGIFGAAQGVLPLNFTQPGEYSAKVLAKYVDSRGTLWVSAMRHAGVVYDPSGNLVARGKKVDIGGKLLDRGDTGTEGYTDASGVAHLQHINFPFNSGDVLLIASEGQGDNKIEPVLSYDYKDRPLPYDTGMQGIGLTNLAIQTSNGLSPHMFPEYIAAWQYYYGAAPRPGFMGRFIVADSGTRAPYWKTSNNASGGQINAAPNGDATGDIYRLIGGVVMRPHGQAPQYAGYLSSAFMLPGGTKNNRVIAADSEDLRGPYNQNGRLFLVGTRPGMTYQTGTLFGPAVQVDPVLPASLTFELEFPDGHRMATSGIADATGSWAGDKWTLDAPGIYKFHLSGEWNGNPAVMPGLPPEGGFLYVVEANRPANAAGLRFDLPVESMFDPKIGTTITGHSTASTVAYAALIPGTVLDQGTLAVTGGTFRLTWDPQEMNRRSATYDTVNQATGKPALYDVVHLTFFSEETAPDGTTYHSFQRILLRGNRMICTK
jgi:hypothetical protein